MTCIHCEKQIADGSAFCSGCGQSQQQSKSTSIAAVGGDITQMDNRQLAAAFAESAKLLADYEEFADAVDIYEEVSASEGEHTGLNSLKYRTGELQETVKHLTGADKAKFYLMVYGSIPLTILAAMLYKVPVIAVICLLVSVSIIFYAIHFAHKTAKGHTDVKIDTLKPHLEAALCACEQSTAIMSIPPAYRYSFAMEQMLQLVENRRANTWVECADKYEELVHRLRMQQATEEIIELTAISAYYTAQAASSARAAALFSGLNFFLK